MNISDKNFKPAFSDKISNLPLSDNMYKTYLDFVAIQFLDLNLLTILLQLWKMFIFSPDLQVTILFNDGDTIAMLKLSSSMETALTLPLKLQLSG